MEQGPQKAKKPQQNKKKEFRVMASLHSIPTNQPKRTNRQFVKDVALDVAANVKDEANEYANRKLKELGPLLENMICNVALIAGKEAGYQLGAQISSLISDQAINIGKQYGIDYLLDRCTGMTMGYLLQGIVDLNDRTQSISIVARLLIDLSTKGANKVILTSITENIVGTFGPEFAKELLKQIPLGSTACNYLTEQIAAKPTVYIAKYISPVNTAMDMAEQISKPYKVVKQAIIDNVTTPVVDVIYNNGVKNSIVDFWSAVSNMAAEKSVEEANARFIEGQFVQIINDYADHCFPIPIEAISAKEAEKYTDLTDNAKNITEIKSKEKVVDSIVNFAARQANALSPEVSSHISDTVEIIGNVFQSVFHIPDDSMSKIFNGEKLTSEDLEKIDENKPGHSSYSARFGRALFGAGISLAKGAKDVSDMIYWNHDKWAANYLLLLQECAQNKFSSESLDKLLDINAKLDSYNEKYPNDIEIINQKIKNGTGEAFASVMSEFSVSSGPNQVNVEKIISLLINKGCNPSILNSQGVNPLHLAVAKIKDNKKCTELFEKLFNIENCNISELTKLGLENILHLAAFHGKSDVVNMILTSDKVTQEEKKNLIQGISRSFETPLHMAARNGHKEIMITLLKNNADLMATNEDGETPFDVIKDREILNDPAIVAILNEKLKNNLATPAPDQGYSIEYDRRLLIVWGASPSLFETSPPYLEGLLKEGGFDFAYFLIQSIANEQDKTEAEVMQSLLSKDATLDMVNINGDPILLAALKGGNYSFASLLLEMGANPLLQNDSNMSTEKYFKDYKNFIEESAKEGVQKVLPQFLVRIVGAESDPDYRNFSNLIVEKLKPEFAYKHYLTKPQIQMRELSNLFNDTTKKVDEIKKEVLAFIKDNPELLNMKDIEGNTLLHYAYKSSQFELGLWMINSAQANPLTPNNEGYSFKELWNSLSNTNAWDASRWADPNRVALNNLMKKWPNEPSPEKFTNTVEQNGDRQIAPGNPKSKP